MEEHDFELIKLLVKKMAESVDHKKLMQRKPWKELSGEEWTKRCVDSDWEKDRPRMGWWKEKD